MCKKTLATTGRPFLTLPHLISRRLRLRDITGAHKESTLAAIVHNPRKLVGLIGLSLTGASTAVDVQNVRILHQNLAIDWPLICRASGAKIFHRLRPGYCLCQTRSSGGGSEFRVIRENYRAFAPTLAACYRIAMPEPISFRPSAAAIPSRLKLWAGRISWAAVAPVAVFATRFGRTFILSRLLAPGEFGITVAITIVITTAELATDVGLEKFILLKPAADAHRALAAAHALQIFRGLLLFAAIAVLAVPAVTFFGVPQAVASFKFAALVPLVRSFAHLGIQQIQRDYDYRPVALALTASNVTGLAVTALAAATILPDHRVIILAFLVDAAVYVAVSHILAQAPMRVVPDRETLRQSLAYGLPLMLNGAGLALLSQADRMVVGRFFGMDILGVYAVVLGLAVAPISPLFQVTGGLGMSMLARSRETPKRHLENYLWLAWFFAFVAFGYAAFIGLTLDVLAPLVFGKAYAVGTDTVILISAIVFLRILRGGPTVALLMSSATTRLTLANLMSVFGVAAAAALAQVHPVLTSVLAGVLFGDVLTVVLLQWAGIAPMPNGIGSIWRSLAVAGAGVAILTTTLRLLPDPSWTNRGIVAASCALPAAILGLGMLRRWRLRELT